MPVSYTSDIYTKNRLFFLKLLFRWAGSVWQLLWVDFLFFAFSYVLLAAVYHKVLETHEHRQITFESVVRWLSKIRTHVPLSFMLGFFVTTVLSRWWTMCTTIPWLTGPSFYMQALLSSAKPVNSDIARKIRITIMRYYNLSWILMMATISGQIKDRFGFRKPNDSKSKKNFKLTWRRRLELINADDKVRKRFGLLVTPEEVQTFARSAELSNNDALTYSPEYWLPLAWATRLLRRAKAIGLIEDERQYLFLVELTGKMRGDLGSVWSMSEFSVPLVYTQVAVTAVYLFLFSTLLSTQMVKADVVKPHDVSLGPATINGSVNPSASLDAVLGVEILSYIPVLGSLEFIFYLGWFKIGICLLNPLGRDKADLPLSDILNSNLKSSVKIGGAEDSLYPPGLANNGEPEEQQVATLLRCFDFGLVNAHDEFAPAAEVDEHLHKALLRRLQGTGKDIVNTLDVFQLMGSNARRQDRTDSASRQPTQQRQQASGGRTESLPLLLLDTGGREAKRGDSAERV